MKFKKINKNKIQAIYYMIIASFLLSFISVIVNYISEDLHPFQIFSLGCFVSSIFSGGWVLIHGSNFKDDQKKAYYFFRAFFGTISMIMWYYVIRSIPIVDATAISYLTPLFNLIAASIILKEKLNRRRILVVCAGLSGGVIILHPIFSLDDKIGYIVALLTTFIWVVADIFAKLQSKSNNTMLQCFFITVIMFILSFPLALLKWSPFSLKDLLLIILLGITQLLNLYTIFRAYHYADMTVVVPFDFSRLIFTGIFGVLLFNEPIKLTVVIGALIVLSSIIYLIRKEIKL